MQLQSAERKLNAECAFELFALCRDENDSVDAFDGCQCHRTPVIVAALTIRNCMLHYMHCVIPMCWLLLISR
ncbi:hypothetical protein PR002_g6319 [Phytophthora rubi]|uniref:Uncharacterized protein n=1 Tax=Phytophthora rubi TaxID=129364 RepID=A0A6A3MXI5_9STRA|nr:hypothetical protein PR002_g6319 [Phytophthora rubi]